MYGEKEFGESSTELIEFVVSLLPIKRLNQLILKNHWKLKSIDMVLVEMA